MTRAQTPTPPTGRPNRAGCPRTGGHLALLSPRRVQPPRPISLQAGFCDSLPPEGHHPPTVGLPSQTAPGGVRNTESTGATRPLAPGRVPVPDRCWYTGSPVLTADTGNRPHALTNPPLDILFWLPATARAGRFGRAPPGLVRRAVALVAPPANTAGGKCAGPALP